MTCYHSTDVPGFLCGQLPLGTMPEAVASPEQIQNRIRLIQEIDWSIHVGMSKNPADAVHHSIEFLIDYIRELEFENKMLRLI